MHYSWFLSQKFFFDFLSKITSSRSSGHFTQPPPKFLPVWLSPWQMVVRWNSPLDMDWTQVDLETWEWLRVSLDLVVFWSWLGQGLDPELDNMQKVIRCLFFSKDSSIYSTIKYCPLKETKFSWRTRSLTYTNFVFF